MGEIINFPNNYDRFIEEAVKYHKMDHLEKAIENYLQAYKIKQNFQLNQILVSSYLENGQAEEAKGLVDEYDETYKSAPEWKLLYVSVLIENSEFDEASILIEEELKNEFQESDSQTWLSTRNKLAEKEGKEREEFEQFKVRTKEMLYSLSSYSVEEQLSIVKNASYLEEETMKDSARIIFPNPFVNHFAKIGLLEYLISQNDRSIYEFDWLSTKKEVDVSQLTIFEKDPIVNRVTQLLEDKLEKNPSLLEIVFPVVQLHLMTLFPFTSQVIMNPEKWVGLYLTRFGDKQEIFEGDEEFEKMKEWFEFLNDRELT